MEIIDISMPVQKGMTAWPGLTKLDVSPFFRMTEGAGANVTDLHCCAHTGTHVDSPFHHYPDAVGMEGVPLNTLMGRGYVMDLSHVGEAIHAEDLAPLESVEPFDILLTRTRNSTEKELWDGDFLEDYIYIAPDGAEEIVRRGIRSVAVDCLSVEGYQLSSQGAPTHKILLKDGAVTIIEGVDLRNIEPGHYWFACLPLNIVGSDGAPARAVLVKDADFHDAWQPR